MIILNVSFGLYAFLPQGWVFMVVIILIECLGLSYLLTKSWKEIRICKTVAVSNIVSGIIGIMGSLLLNGGWWLVVWFPWVSDNEVRGTQELKGLAIYYLIAFLLTIIIEGMINYLLLKKDYQKSRITRATLIINTLSYLAGSLAMYSYSF